MSKHSRYRIRSLIDSTDLPQSEFTLMTSAEASHFSPEQLVSWIPRPHLTDLLYHFRSLQKLGMLCPSFHYVQPRSSFRPIKNQPIYLAEYVSRFDECHVKILEEWDKQQSVQQGIANLLDAKESDEDPPEIEGSLAAAIGCHLFRGHRKTKGYKSQIIADESISAGGAYVAFSSGEFWDNGESLLDKISQSPDLTLELSRSSGVRQKLGECWFDSALKKHPVHLALFEWLTDKAGALGSIPGANSEDPVAAAICLSINPHSEKAKRWKYIVFQCQESMYWATLFWRKCHRNPREFPLETNFSADPRWLYHWCRDVDPTDIRDKLTAIWPDPWAVELIEDADLPKDLVLNLYNQSELNTENPTHAAVSLWALDHVS